MKKLLLTNPATNAVLLLSALLLLLGLACAGSAASIQGQYPYWRAATDTPTPTPTPGPIHCPEICIDENGGIKPGCEGSIFPYMPAPCQMYQPETIIGPTQTPYFKHYAFYREQPVNMLGGLVIRFEGAYTTTYNGKNYHVLVFKAWNNSGGAIAIMYPLTAMIREIEMEDGTHVGTWTADEDAPALIGALAKDMDYYPLMADEDHTMIPANANGLTWIAVVQAPPGGVPRYMLMTDPMSNNTQSHIIFINSLPPDRGVGPKFNYHGEISPGDYPLIVEYPEVAYYDVPDGGSSAAYASYKGITAISGMGPTSFDYSTFAENYGSMQPLSASGNPSQGYGCSSFGSPGKCAYTDAGDRCADVQPKCKSWTTGEDSVGWHNGIDWGAPLGTPIYAAVPGKIVAVVSEGCANVNYYEKPPSGPGAACYRENFGYGFYIDLLDNNGYLHRYAHLSSKPTNIKVGVTVARGQEIARVGSSGWSTGPHLHYMVKTPNGMDTNPLTYLGTVAVAVEPEPDLPVDKPSFHDPLQQIE